MDMYDIICEGEHPVVKSVSQKNELIEIVPCPFKKARPKDNKSWPTMLVT